ncbi:tRNA epoxyqueuosine(34) reductase QueG [Thermaerobacter litoralis]
MDGMPSVGLDGTPSGEGGNPGVVPGTGGAEPLGGGGGAQLKAALVAEARRLGFVAVGVAAATPQLDLAALLRRRQALGMATPWEDPDPVRRTDPESLLPGARSVVAVAMAYDPPGRGPRGGAAAGGDAGGLRGYVAAAGRTRSYQHVMGRRLEALGRWLEARVPGCRWAVQVDTGPLVDRAWAERAGIGWIGKNACLIVPGWGSWVFLGELVTDVALPPDQPLADACAGCDRCLRACPTGAFLGPRQLDPRRCISFLSQKPGMLDAEERAALGQSLYGCDACQAVCPFNHPARPGHPALRLAGGGDPPAGEPAAGRFGAAADEPAPGAAAGQGPAPETAAGEGSTAPNGPLAGPPREAGDEPAGGPAAPPGGGDAPGSAPPVGDDLARPPLVPLLQMGRAAFQARYRPLTGAWRGRKTWQRNAIVALGNRGPGARAAVPALAALLRDDPRPDIRALAAWALGRIGGDEAGEALRAARDGDADPHVCRAAAEALGRLAAERAGRPALAPAATGRGAAPKDGAARPGAGRGGPGDENLTLQA